MSRTLVVAPQWIGDAVMSEPLLRRLRARGERLSVAAVPWVAPIYHAMPQVEEVLELPFTRGRLDWSRRRRLALSLRGRFDAAYVLPNSIKSALLPWLARIPVRTGYVGEGRYVLLNRTLPNPTGRPPMVGFYAALAGSPSTADGRPQLAVDPGRIDAVAAAAAVPSGRYWVFAPGAEYGPAKRWPVERYAELARSLATSSTLPVLLLGSAGEASLCDAIAAAAPGSCTVLAGKLSLLDAVALIAGARGVVSNDSGLMHVAAAFSVPQVAVFGSTSPLHTPPLNPNARVLWLKEELGLACMPCFERTCRYGHTGCLGGVDADRVEAALAQAMEPEVA
jgi:heptosyltransferase-2